MGTKSCQSPAFLLLWPGSPGILYLKIKYHCLGQEGSSGECEFDGGLERQWRTFDKEF